MFQYKYTMMLIICELFSYLSLSQVLIRTWCPPIWSHPMITFFIISFAYKSLFNHPIVITSYSHNTTTMAGRFSFKATSSIFCLLFITTVISQVNANETPQDFHYFRDSNNDIGNYTTIGRYSQNLHISLTIITAQTFNTNGFYATSSGSGINKVNAVAQCRGDGAPAPWLDHHVFRSNA